MVKVTQEEYRTFLNNLREKGIKVVIYSTFSDIDGTLSFGHGFPCMETNYAIEGEDEIIATFIESKSHWRDEIWRQEFYIKSEILTYLQF